MEQGRCAVQSRGSIVPLLVVVGYGIASLLVCSLSQRLGVQFTTCVLKYTTGIPCPFCGGTRAAWALLHGDLLAALALNPLAAVACLLLPPGYLLHRLYLRDRQITVPRPAWIALIALTVANWAYLIAVGR